ncbi:MAG: hypothetical protein ABI379_10310 [Rhodanobacter sp.]
MKQLATSLFLALVLVFTASSAAYAKQDTMDVARLTASLDQLANDQALGGNAQAEQARARDAINQLARASRSERPRDLYLAERLVDLAKVAAQLQDAQTKLAQLDREHDQILLENSRRDAAAARRELERQRLQYQLAQEESARLQAQGQAYSEAADQARAEAEKAKKLAAAQSRVATAARRQAALAARAAKEMRSQMQQDQASEPAAASSAPKKGADKHETKQHPKH